jgi:hypothetical protein
MSGHLRRIFTSIILSIIINLFLFMPPFFSAPSKERSQLDRFTDIFVYPAGIFTEWFFPERPSLRQIILLFGSSFLFYAAVTWMIIMLVVWVREEKSASAIQSKKP